MDNEHSGNVFNRILATNMLKTPQFFHLSRYFKGEGVRRLIVIKYLLNTCKLFTDLSFDQRAFPHLQYSHCF